MTNRNIDNLAGCDVRHGTLPEGGGRVPDPDFHHVATGLYFWPGAVPGLRDERMSFGSNPYYEKTTRMNTEPTPKREFTGVWIPAIIWERADLNCTEKCLLAEIHALGGHRGNCFAGNEYLGKQVGGLSPVRIGAIISKLKGLGLIRQVSFDGRVRKLQTLFDAKCGNEADPSKMRGRSNQKRGGGPIENEGALIVEGKIEKKIEEEEITPADAGDVTKPESEPVVEKPKAPVKIFAEQWWGAYKRHNGMPYSPPNARREPRQQAKETDEAWLKGLESNPAYAGLDVAREHAKMVAWCSVNGKQPSRRRFVNWLNRAEKPMRVTRATTEDEHLKGF